MKTLRMALLGLALVAGGTGSAYAHDSFGLSINLGIPGYYVSPPPPVYYAPPPAVYYEPAPIVYRARPRAYVYYEEPRVYYGGERYYRHERHHDRRWRDD